MCSDAWFYRYSAPLELEAIPMAGRIFARALRFFRLAYGGKEIMLLGRNAKRFRQY